MRVETPMTPDEAKELVSGPLGEAALKAVAGYVSPIFWVVQNEDGEDIVPNNGTMFFVDAGQGAFAVTANHVYQGYLDALSAHRLAECVILPKSFDGPARQPLPFDPETRLIDRSPDPDIATFRMTAEELERLGTTTITAWPPVIPEEGKGILFAGFPGHERMLTAPFELSFAVYPGLAVATSVTEWQISCQFEQEYAVQTQGFQLPPPHYGTDGMSGAPLLTVVERNELQHWALGGVIYEGSPNLDILFAARADYILPDGKLRQANRP